MKDCKIIEDLLPLYEEGLVQSETATWITQHIDTCDECKNLLHMATRDFTSDSILPSKAAATMIKQTNRKLAFYQIIFVALSFLLAISTSLLNESFNFIATYFLLGFVTFYFYRSSFITILIAALPILLWTIVDTIQSHSSFGNYVEAFVSNGQGTVFSAVIMLLVGGVFMAIIHTIFALLGAVVAFFSAKLFAKEEAS